VTGATFEEVVDIACGIDSVRHQEREERKAKRPRGSGSFGEAQSAHPGYHGIASGHSSHSSHQGHSSLSALPSQSPSRAPSIQGSSMPGASASHSGVRSSL